jgi:hypothetical protein
MVLTFIYESQAVVGLLSSALQRPPPAAELPTPPLAFRSARRPARAPAGARARAPSCWGRAGASSDPWALGVRAGPSRADPAHTLGFRRQVGGRLRGLPSSDCRAQLALSSPLRVAVLAGRAASTPTRGSLRALRRRVAPAAMGLGPSLCKFLLLRAVCWPGRGLAEPQGAGCE